MEGAIWSFVGPKAKNVSLEKKAEALGGAMLGPWTARRRRCQTLRAYLTGSRITGCAKDFMQNCRERIVGNP